MKYKMTESNNITPIEKLKGKRSGMLKYANFYPFLNSNIS